MIGPSKQESDYFLCPHCGAGVPVGASFCRACGSDSETGWAEEDDNWEGDPPDGYAEGDFDYHEVVRREFPGQFTQSPGLGLPRWAWVLIVAITLFGLMQLWVIR